MDNSLEVRYRIGTELQYQLKKTHFQEQVVIHQSDSGDKLNYTQTIFLTPKISPVIYREAICISRERKQSNYVSATINLESAIPIGYVTVEYLDTGVITDVKNTNADDDSSEDGKASLTPLSTTFEDKSTSLSLKSDDNVDVDRFGIAKDTIASLPSIVTDKSTSLPSKSDDNLDSLSKTSEDMNENEDRKESSSAPYKYSPFFLSYGQFVSKRMDTDWGADPGQTLELLGLDPGAFLVRIGYMN